MNIWRQQKNRFWKPSVGAQIDWGHPLASGMDSCLLFNEQASGRGSTTAVIQPWKDLVGTNRWTWILGSAPVTKMGPWGPLIFCADGTQIALAPTRGFPTNAGAWTARTKVKLSTAGFSGNAVGWCCGGSGGEAGFSTRGSAGQGRMASYSGSGTEVDATLGSVIANVWYDHVWVYNGAGHMTMYQNGRLTPGTSAGFAYTPGSTALNAILNTTNAYSPFDGYMDLFMHWKRALSPGEIAWLWQDPYAMIRGPLRINAGSAGATHSQSFSANMGAFAGAVVKSSAKGLAASTANWSGIVNRSAAKGLNASTANWSASIAKSSGKGLAATMSAWAGSIAKSSSKSLNAILAAWAGTLAKLSTRMKLLTATMSPWSASITTLGVKTKAFAATMSLWSASIAKSSAKNLTASMSTWAGALAKLSRKSLNATLGAWSGLLAIPGQMIHMGFAATMAGFSGLLTFSKFKGLGRSIRLQIFNAVEALLNSGFVAGLNSIRLEILNAAYQLFQAGGGPVNLSVYKERLRPIEKTALPAILIYADDDTPRTLASQVYKAPLTERQLSLVVECRAQGTETMTADEALDPLLVWAEQVIVQNEQFGGLATGVEELRTVWLSHEGEIPVAAAAIHFTVKYRTARGDLTKKDPNS